MQKQTCKKRIIFSTSIYSLIMGFAVKSFMPAYPNIELIFYFLGIYGLFYYIYTWSKFDHIFLNLKLGIGIEYPIQKSRISNGDSITYKFTLPPGLCTEDFIKKQSAIEEHLGKKINIEHINRGLFIIEVFNKTKLDFFDYEPLDINGSVPIIIGKTRQGKMITFDLSEDDPHMLIAGSSGCGKSTILRSIITNLILKTNVNLHLIDLKHGAEFALFGKSSRVISFAKVISEVEEVLAKLNREIEKRYSLFAKYDLNDIKAYNNKFSKNPLPYEVLIIDEMIDFQANKNLFYGLEVIAAKARACGIHMILSTQRPDKDILNGRIKSNVTNVLGLKTKDNVNSRIVIDTDGLEKLAGMGHGILSRLGSMTEIQTPYLSVEKAKELVKYTYVNKSTSRPETKPQQLEIKLEDLEVLWD